MKISITIGVDINGSDPADREPIAAIKLYMGTREVIGVALGRDRLNPPSHLFSGLGVSCG